MEYKREVAENIRNWIINTKTNDKVRAPRMFSEIDPELQKKTRRTWNRAYNSNDVDFPWGEKWFSYKMDKPTGNRVKVILKPRQHIITKLGNEKDPVKRKRIIQDYVNGLFKANKIAGITLKKVKPKRSRAVRASKSSKSNSSNEMKLKLEIAELKAKIAELGKKLSDDRYGSSKEQKDIQKKLDDTLDEIKRKSQLLIEYKKDDKEEKKIDPLIERLASEANERALGIESDIKEQQHREAYRDAIDEINNLIPPSPYVSPRTIAKNKREEQKKLEEQQKRDKRLETVRNVINIMEKAYEEKSDTDSVDFPDNKHNESDKKPSLKELIKKASSDAKEASKMLDELDEPKSGQGKKQVLPALWNDQIDDYFTDYPNFTGAICIDEISSLPYMIPQGFIFNTSPTTKAKGEHWIGVYIDGNSVNYFDSFGDPPSDDFKDQITKLVDNWQLPNMLKLKYNRVQMQDDKTNTCGFFAIKFVQDMLDGNKFKQASGFIKHVKKSLDKPFVDLSKVGERIIGEEFSLI